MPPASSGFDLTLGQLEVALAPLSLVSSLLILISMLVFPNLRRASHNLVLQLGLSSGLAELITLLGLAKMGTFPCRLLSYLHIGFILAQASWTVVISYSLLNAVCNQKSGKKLGTFLIFAYGVPFVLALLPALTSRKSEPVEIRGDEACYVNMAKSVSPTASGALALYIPIWAVILYHLWVFRRVRLAAQAMSDVGPGAELQREKINSTITRLRIFPGILVCCWVPGTLSLIVAAAHGEPVLWLQALHVLARSLQGPLNGVGFWKLPGVKESWAGACCARTRLVSDDSEGRTTELLPTRGDRPRPSFSGWLGSLVGRPYVDFRHIEDGDQDLTVPLTSSQMLTMADGEETTL